MRKTAMAFLFCLLSPIANAQEEITFNFPVKCGKADLVFNYLAENYQEKPIWVGKTARNTHVTLLVNKDNHSWIIVEYDSALACILGGGDASSSPSI